MNATIARALLEDAFEQVLDNRVFRLLLVVVLAIVAFFFLVGFGPEEIEILWGWRTVSYADLFGSVGQSSRGIEDPQALVIQTVVGLLVETLAGSLGMALCVCATAFFVPRMLEKGAADVLFAKPVSRTTLLFARWSSGLLFVAMLSALLLGGIWLGLWIVSGWHDPGILWGVVTLTYLFAIVHSFSTLVGVLTRSTVAAILLSLFFFMGTGCVHQTWRILEFGRDTGFLAAADPDSDADAGEDPEVERPARRRGGDVAGWLHAFVSPLHHALPKTSDADVLTRKLRRAIAGGPVSLVDEPGGLVVRDALGRLDLLSPDRSLARGDVLRADLGAAPAVWEQRDEQDVVAVRAEIRRASRLEAAEEGEARRRPKRASAATLADRIRDRIVRDVPDASAPDVSRRPVASVNAPVLVWQSGPPDARRQNQLAVLAFGDHVYEIEVSTPAGAVAGRRRTAADELYSRLQLGAAEDAPNPDAWYDKRFGWTAPWKFNALASIGTSLAFVAAVFAFAAWRLARADL